MAGKMGDAVKRVLEQVGRTVFEEPPPPDMPRGCVSSARLSGFLPVQSVYADFYVVDEWWPDYRDEHFDERHARSVLRPAVAHVPCPHHSCGFCREHEDKQEDACSYNNCRSWRRARVIRRCVRCRCLTGLYARKTVESSINRFVRPGDVTSPETLVGHSRTRRNVDRKESVVVSLNDPTLAHSETPFHVAPYLSGHFKDGYSNRSGDGHP